MSPPTRRRVAAGLLLAPTIHSRARASNVAVRLDVDDAGWPELAPWIEALRSRVVRWWPVMARALASPRFAAPDVVHIRFIEMTPDVLARLSGTPFYRRLDVHARNIGAITRNGTIRVNAPFVLARIDDPEMLGMMAHELTHVVQSYPHGAATWLAEGIADYVRFYVLMPEDPARAFDPAQARYDSGYQATAGLLDWLETARPGAVREINAVLRAGEDGTAALDRVGGARPEDLWRAYLSTCPAAASRYRSSQEQGGQAALGPSVCRG